MEDKQGYENTGTVLQSYDTIFSSELCWRKAIVAYTMPQQLKKEGEWLRGEGIRSSLLIFNFKESKF